MAYKSSFGSRRVASLPRRLMPWLSLSAVVILADQLSKIAVRDSIALAARVHILPFFDLTLIYNRGAAFSFLNSESGWQRWFFTALGLIAALFIIFLLAKHGTQRLFAFGLALILGGALGNVIDRIAYGHVVDFLLFYYRDWFFPAFNLADSAITVGAILLAFDELRRVRRS